MIRIHATRKLVSKLPLDADGLLPESKKTPHLYLREVGEASALGDWHTNLLTIQRRGCVLFVHDETRFPLFAPALNKQHLANLDRWFDDALINTLMKCGVADALLEKAGHHVHRLRIDTHCNRSVQGTMNRMAFELEHTIRYSGVRVDEITGYRHAAWLADTPCNVKGRKDALWPKRDFIQFLEALPEIQYSETSRSAQ